MKTQKGGMVKSQEYGKQKIKAPQGKNGGNSSFNFDCTCSNIFPFIFHFAKWQQHK